jgi:hypothetical protein
MGGSSSFGGSLTKEAHAHEIKTSVVVPAPPEFFASADIALKVEVSCSSACDLRDGTVKIVSRDGAVVKEAKLVTFDGKTNQTAEIEIKAPTKAGENAWKTLFPAQEKEGIKHAESSAQFSFTVKPHPTSMKVLDFPDPVAVGQEFSVKVGVKCSAGCKLANRGLGVYTANGAKVGTGVVGDVQLPGETALWLAELKLKAPEVEGRARWTVMFPKSDLEPPHDESSCFFDFGIGGHPDQVVTVEVVDRDTKLPVKDAQVLLRPTVYRGYAYSSRTNEAGVARIGAGREEYQLYVSGNGKEFFLPIVNVAGDMTIKAEVFVQERHPWDY